MAIAQKFLRKSSAEKWSISDESKSLRETGPKGKAER
jgi:hypothetical protein